MAGKPKKRVYESIGDAPESFAKRAGTSTPIVRGKPLAYPSLKWVLTYLDPNKRFEVYRRLPSLRLIEQAIPLKIKELDFSGENSVKINHVKYSLGIYREFSEKSENPEKESTSEPAEDKKVPKLYKKGNKVSKTINNATSVNDRQSEEIKSIEDKESGSRIDKVNGIWVKTFIKSMMPNVVPYDLDEFGFREVSFDKILSPGDISIFELPQTKLTKEEGERKLNNLRTVYMHRPQSTRISRKLPTKHEDLCVIYSLEHFLKNQPIPFDNFVQLTVEEEGKKTRIERVPYSSCKIHEAFRTLTTTFFHHKTIKVERLNVTSTPMILRLPPNLKLHVSTFFAQTDAGRMLNQVEPIIADSSFPLHSLGTHLVEGSNISTIRNKFEILIIHGKFAYDRGDIRHYSKIMHVVDGTSFSSCFWRTENGFTDFLQHWLKIGKEIGTCLTAEYYTEEYAMEVLKLLKNNYEFNFKIKENRLLKLDANEYSMIQVTVGELSISNQTWQVKMEVVPMEYH